MLQHCFIGGNDSSEGPLIVFLHGGGYSGLTWAPLSKELTHLVNCQTLAIDLRGHGCTQTEDDADLSAETMASDIANVIEEHVKSLNSEPEVVLIGHSMGGALAVHAGLTEKINPLIGLVVVDVVEGTAMDALSSMQSFLRSRPQAFPSIEYAIEWSMKSGQVRNGESARVSMPGQLKNTQDNKCVALSISENELENSEQAKIKVVPENSIREEDEEEKGDEPKEKQFKAPEMAKPLSWRIDLAKSEPHWTGWFTKLSEKFLSVPASKMLILAGIDRLDKDLTVGQMQGKFQMQVLPQAGHAVHEDVPEKMAEVLATFLVRNRFASAKETFCPTFPAC